MTVYSDAAPVIKPIADKLIRAHHPDLADVDIRYVFRDKAARSRGKTVLGKAKLITGLNMFLATGRESDVSSSEECEPFFVIELAEDTWRVLDTGQRKALVDHELCHCIIELDDDTGEPRARLRAHDVEAFVAEIERHGLWKPELEDLAKAVVQLQLPLAEAD